MKNKMYKKHLICATLYILGFALSFCTGCGKPYGELFPVLETSLVWPEPPDRPRIRFVGMISTENDLSKEVSWSENLVELIFGKKDIGVLLNPYAVVIDEKDNMFVVDTAGGVVHVFGLNTRQYNQFSALVEKETLIMPVALTIVDENIYVVDSVLHKICVFGRNGKFKFSFGSEHLKRPSGIAYDVEKQKIYISDTAAHSINVFNKDGDFTYKIGARGLDPGLFNFPTHLWVDKSGQLYVSDTLNYRIQIFSNDGTFLKMFGKHGNRPGNFAHPSGIATDSFGHIYVTDRKYENVQIFDNAGRILMAFGKEGNELGEFWLPAGIYIDNRNRVYIADSFNKRLQVFELIEGAEK
ncbi:MAG: 6-bladed beta-propeller [Planctomycetota bacterium]|jgi:DNA-binding beta-propeller fold protein YncE